MTPIPDLDDVDAAFGYILHMPAYDTIPDEFKNRNRRNAYSRFVSEWFYKGRTEGDIARLIPEPGVDKPKALRAIKSILVSFEPEHEHKEAGAAYLLSEWFELADEPASDGEAA